jgi:general secretion pathway protein L
LPLSSRHSHDAWSAATLDQEIARGRSAATEAGKLRREIERLSGSAELIDSERDKAGRSLVVLAALTRMLPADTYLTEFRQLQQQITVSGRSAAASRLIGALSAGEQRRNPSFAAPVTRIEAIRAEVFTITVEVVP